MLRRLIAPLSIVIVAGCAASMAPETERPGFDYGHVGLPGAPEGATKPPTVRVRQGGIEVLGIITTPHPCVVIEAELERGGRTITLTIAARGDGSELCVGVLGEFAYAADVSDLEPGTYRVVVSHAIPQSGWPTATVLDEDVAVP